MNHVGGGGVNAFTALSVALVSRSLQFFLSFPLMQPLVISPVAAVQ